MCWLCDVRSRQIAFESRDGTPEQTMAPGESVAPIETGGRGFRPSGLNPRFESPRDGNQPPTPVKESDSRV